MGTTGFVEWRPAYDDESERLVEAARGQRNIFGIASHKESGGHGWQTTSPHSDDGRRFRCG